MMLARERHQRFAGFEQSRYASGEYFSQYLEGDWQPKTEKYARCLPALASPCRRVRCGNSCVKR